MNKKVLTLCAAMLLSGSSLVSVYASDFATSPTSLSGKWQKEVTVLQGRSGISLSEGKLTLTENAGFEDQRNFLLINENDYVFDGQNHTWKGRIVVTGKNVTIKNLNIEYLNAMTSDDDGTVIENKSAITVFESSVNIENCTISCSVLEGYEEKYMANGITLYPLSAAPEYKITKTTIKNASSINPGDDVWPAAPSFGVQILGNLQDVSNNGFTYFASSTYEKSATISDFSKCTFDITYDNCATDFGYIEVTGVVNAGAGVYDVEDYKNVILTPNSVNGKITNTAAIAKAITKATEGAVVKFEGSVEELDKVLQGTTISNNVAVVCDGANALFGDAKNPDNGQAAVVKGVEALSEEIFGYELAENATSDYSMLIYRSNNKNFAISTNETNLATQVTSSNIDKFAKDPKALWKMTSKTDHDGTIWYQFENQDEEVLEVNNNKWFAAGNNIAYKNGVILHLGGEDLKDGTANYFGLYKAGNQVLSVEDLMWYENDGFSVTIYHDAKDDDCFSKEHLATDIAGNPFQMHLTPMKWNESTKKFVEFTTTTDNAEEFYLKDTEGNYIVAQKYASSGSTQSQSTYVFTTVTEKALEHDLATGEGNYFGLFQAEVSAKYTDLKTLTAIDVLKVYVAGSWAEIGRLDLGTAETPTLAASVSTDLKPILISLGSNKVVNPKTFLQKGKFYTVTKLDKDGKGKYLAVAGDKYEGSEGDWFVESYGNELEIQFALTYENGYFVFSNRETPSYRWSYLQANQLYYGEGENEYVYGSTTYVIAPVKEHKATDGYDNETLADVKNNKFHIGFVSGVFDNNAWFTENHEGTNNHTIGLDVDVENALTFTATKYDAARKIEHNATNHTDTYYPTDSIYVISELGYYEGNDYKTTKDTLKIVSYSFVNQWNEPLVYGDAYSSSARYVSLPINPETGKRFASVAEAAPFAQKFALRKDNGKLNLRPVNDDFWNGSGNSDSYLTHQDFNKSMKVYAGDATNGILDEQYLYDRTENDLFVVEPTEKPMYRRVVSPLDTISIYRNDNSQSVLFESGKFLGMENLSQFPNLAPGMIADTAYIGNGDETYYRPQYLLAVDAIQHGPTTWCPDHGYGATCQHAIDIKGYLEGRFLVNLKDTAIAWATANKHKDGNPYINSENYYKLGFVQATHRNDSLIVASDPENRIFVGDENFNVAKFAFRYVDSEEGSFVIETADYVQLPDENAGELKDSYGYLKWMNGVVVVVDDIKNADVYNMNEAFEGDPTANETIAAGNVVVAGVDGAVVVKGAEGKNVIVSTILGKVVANEVLTSDNAQIATPAGIVVVSVDGESFKVVVK